MQVIITSGYQTDIICKTEVWNQIFLDSCTNFIPFQSDRSVENNSFVR